MGMHLKKLTLEMGLNELVCESEFSPVFFRTSLPKALSKGPLPNDPAEVVMSIHPILPSDGFHFW